MTHDQFTAKYNGKFCDFDKNYSFQCVDLMRQYVQDVYGVPGYNSDLPALGNWGHAKDLFLKFPLNSKYFKKVLNTPTGIPPKGAIIFFNTTPIFKFPKLYGIDGHVAIIDSAGLMSMRLFGQNYPTGTVSSFRKFAYQDCLGWLIKK